MEVWGGGHLTTPARGEPFAAVEGTAVPGNTSLLLLVQCWGWGEVASGVYGLIRKSRECETPVVNPGLGTLVKVSIWTIENFQQRQTK